MASAKMTMASQFNFNYQGGFIVKVSASSCTKILLNELLVRNI